MDIKFVKNVMDKLLLGEDEVLIKLREQYNHSIIGRFLEHNYSCNR